MEQNPAPGLEVVPGLQGSQPVDPASLENVFSGHSMHCDPAVAVYLPMGQSLHTFAPAKDDDPAGQSIQFFSPDDAENLPRGQVLQDDPAVEE